MWGKEVYYSGNLNNIETINKPAIFLGHLTKHYGHFLWETLTRFWIFLKLNKTFFIDKDIVFISFTHGNFNNMTGYSVLNYIMEALDIQNYSFKKITSVKRYNKIYLPEVMNSWIFGYPKTRENADLQQKLFYSITKNITPKFDNLKIYITRKISEGGRPTTIYDNLFKSLGFKLLDPSSKTFKQDLEYYKSAKIIAGIDGSGLHNVGFMQHPNRYMIELKYRKERYCVQQGNGQNIEENNGLAWGQFFFNWFNNVPYTVIPCFKLSYNEVNDRLNKILIKIDN